MRMDGFTDQAKLVATLLVFFVTGAFCSFVTTSIAQTFRLLRHRVAVYATVGGFDALCALFVAIWFVSLG